MPQTSTTPSKLKQQMDELVAKTGSHPSADEAIIHAPTVPTDEPPIPQNQPAASKPVLPEPGQPASPNRTADRPEGTPQSIEDLSRRIDALRGQLKAQSDRYESDLAALRVENTALQNQLQQVQAEKANGPQQLPSEDEVRQLVTQEQIDEFGIEHWQQILGMMRVAQPTQQPASATSGDIEERLETIEQQAERAKEKAFYERLGQLVPNWREINRQPKFAEFCGTQDPITEWTYDDLLADAYERKNASRAGAVFKTFAETAGIAIASQVVPDNSNAAGHDRTITGGKMPFEEWHKKKQEILRLGLPPQTMQSRVAELDQLMKDGRVEKPVKSAPSAPYV